MPPHADIEICIRSQPRYLCVVRAALQMALERLGIDETAATPIVLSVDEAISNIMRHAYHGETDRPIWFRLTPLRDQRGEGVEIVIEDESDVTPDCIQAMPEEPTTPGGLGVCIIQRSMDTVEFSRRPDDRGLRLRMVKYNASQSAGQ